MQVLDKAVETEFLGREFLTWLWYQSHRREAVFKLEKAGDLELWFDGPVALQSDGSATTQKILCSSETLTEAKLALREGRKVVRANLRVVSGNEEWSLTVEPLWLNLKSLRLPKTGGEDEGLFYERVFLIERITAIMDELFELFLEIRTSPRWREEELPAMRQWVEGGAIPA